MTLLVASGGGVRVRIEWVKVRELAGIKAIYTHRIWGYTGTCIFKKISKCILKICACNYVNFTTKERNQILKYIIMYTEIFMGKYFDISNLL